MKRCELCKSEARVYCDSDQASLCWSCDTRVHSANFLVARHSRCLLCRVCKSPTPWSASGENLGRTVSICERCVHGVKDGRGGAEEESAAGGNDDDEEIDTDGEDDGEDDDTDDDDQLDVENDDGENQLVPPPPAVSSSSREESSSIFCNGDEEVSSKGTFSSPVVSDLNSNDDRCCSYSARSKRTPAAVTPTTGDSKKEFSGSFSSRPLKIRKVDYPQAAVISKSPTTVESLTGDDRVRN